MPKSAKSDQTEKAGEYGPARSFRVSGGRLCSLRVARGWTQVEAAERAGVSERLVRRAEAGESLALRSIAMLAELYSTANAPLSLDELVSGPLAGAPDMVLQAVDLAAIARRWHNELWNLGHLEILGELAAADCVLHAHDKCLRGRAAVRRYIQSTRAAVGEFKLVARRPVVFGDLAVTRWRVRLKSSHTWLTRGPHEKQGVVRGSTWIRVANGLLCEAWTYWHVPFPLPEAPRNKG